MQTFELILIFSLIAVSLEIVADKIDVPLAILQVAVGFGLSFLTMIPDFKIDPSLAFVIFIPPLVYWGALNTSVQELTRQGVSISLLAVGLILLTIGGVALTLHVLMPQMPWSACCVVGAMVAPPDADIMTSVIDKLGLPMHVSSVLEGESLTNDAPSLVSYRLALSALVSGAFSFSNAVPNFIFVALGGVVSGWLFFRGVMFLRERIRPFGSSSLETAISLFSPFVAFILAERIHVSGVLVVATLGFLIIKNSQTMVTAQARLQILTVWQIFIDVIGGFLFILVGFISTRTFHTSLSNGGTALLLPLACIIAAVVGLRGLWVVTEYKILPHLLPKKAENYLETFSWKELLVISWSGMRGGDTLVAALALPYVMPDGSPLPFRLEMTTLALGVLMFTLLVEGLSLKPLIHLLGLHRDYSLKEELNHASSQITKFMIRQIERWQKLPEIAGSVAPGTFENMKRAVLYRRKLDRKRLADERVEGQIQEDQLELRLIRSARRKLLTMRDRDEICDATLRALTRDLDLQTLRFDEMIEGEYGV